MVTVAARAALPFLPAGELPLELLVLLLVLLERLHLALLLRLFVRRGDTVLVPLAVTFGYLTLLAIAHAEAVLTTAVMVESAALPGGVRLVGVAVGTPLLAALASLLLGRAGGIVASASGSAAACLTVVIVVGRAALLPWDAVLLPDLLLQGSAQHGLHLALL